MGNVNKFQRKGIFIATFMKLRNAKIKRAGTSNSDKGLGGSSARTQPYDGCEGGVVLRISAVNVSDYPARFSRCYLMDFQF
jgi:hypothetical protein